MKELFSCFQRQMVLIILENVVSNNSVGNVANIEVIFQPAGVKVQFEFNFVGDSCGAISIEALHHQRFLQFN